MATRISGGEVNWMPDQVRHDDVLKWLVAGYCCAVPSPNPLPEGEGYWWSPAFAGVTVVLMEKT